MQKRRVASISVMVFGVVLVPMFGLGPMAIAAEAPLFAVDSDPEALSLLPEDLPASFSLHQLDLQEAGCDAIFFDEQMPAEGEPWGVLFSLEIAPSVAEAEAIFAAAQDAETVGSSLPMPGPQEIVGSLRLSAQVPGADDAFLIRVESRVDGVHIIEYRYRLRVTNVVVNLAITNRALSSGQEPPSLRESARSVAVRQIERLYAAMS